MRALMAVGAGMLMQQATKAMLSDAKSETACLDEDRAISKSHHKSSAGSKELNCEMLDLQIP